MLVKEAEAELQKMIIRNTQFDEMSDLSTEIGRPDIVCPYYARSSDPYWDFMHLVAKARGDRDCWNVKGKDAKCAWCTMCREFVPFHMKDHSHVIDHMETYHGKHVMTRLKKLEQLRKRRETKKVSEARQLSLLQFFPVVSK
jgi:hypothetical protein